MIFWYHLTWGVCTMKYMTFNNSCFFAAISNILEELEVDVTDEEIVRESLIPFLFEYDKSTDQFLGGYQIQNINVINEYLKKYIVKLNEEKYEQGSLIERKQELIKSLTETDNHKIVSLKMTDNKSEWHATIYTGKIENKYRFINMRKSDNEIVNIELTHDELLIRLADIVQYAWVEKIKTFEVLDKKQMLANSFENLCLLEDKIIEFSTSFQSYGNRMKFRDLLFRPLLLNYVDISRIINAEQLSKDLLKLQSQYISTFKIKGDLVLSEYMDLDLLEESIKFIKYMILSKNKTTYYHGSKTSGIKTLYPNMSIHGEKYVYLTTEREVALIYTVNAIESFYEKRNLEKPNKFHPWYSYGFSKGKLQIVEYYKNAFEDTYKGKSGYLYKCSEPVNDISNKTNVFCAVTTKEDIEVLDEMYIDDIFIELLKLESEGFIEIRRYEDWTVKQISEIEKSIKDTINHFDLHNKPNNHYTIFLRNKFPKLFS